MRVVGVWIVMLVLSATARAEAPAVAHIETVGTGDVPIVLIHDTQGDWRVWESFMERNAERYTMHAIRLAGTGGSEPLPLPEGDPLDDMVWTHEVVTMLAAELEARELDDAFVVGHGLGAVIGMRLAIDHPGSVAGLVLVDAMPAYPLTLDGYQLTQIDRVLHVASGFAGTSEALDPAQWSERWSEVASRQVRSAADAELLFEIAKKLDFSTWRRWTIEQHVPDLTAELAETGVRVLAAPAINTAQLRRFTTRTMVEEFWHLPFDELPESEITFFDDSLHYIFFEHPAEFDAAIARFVAGEEQPEYSFRAHAEEPDPETEAAP